jgi:rhodanese-related sulfurtransferase
MRYIHILDNLVLANREWCDRSIKQNKDRIIHIFRSDIPNYSCKYASNNNVSDEENLLLDYKDAEHLSQEQIQTVVSFINKNKDNQIVVHCHMGRTRSPMIALLCASVLTNLHPIELVGDIFCKLYRNSNDLWNCSLNPLEDIIKWYEERNNE